MPTVSELMSQNNTNAMMNYRLWGNLTYVVSAYDIFPDGTDVTNKLQALVNLANSEGRTAIYFPPGEYYVTYINNDNNIYYFGDNAKFVGGYDQVITQIGSFTENDVYYQEGLSGYARKAFAGGDLLIECWGDSLYASPRSQTEQSVNPAPTVLQSILRSYFNNNNINVTNLGVGGDTLLNRIKTWGTDMGNSQANIVYANYCINDALTQYNVNGASLTYRDNLIEFVEIARKNKKIIVLETPNTVWSARSLNVGMTIEVVEFAKQLVNVMRKVAIEMNVPLIDNFYFTEKYMETGYEGTALWDGLHPTDEVYRFKGLQMASVMVYNSIPRAYEDSIIPVYAPGVLAYGNTADAVLARSKTGRFTVARKFCVPIHVVDNEIDLYVAINKWDAGTTSATIKFDNEVIRSDANFNSNAGFIFDAETLIKKKVKPGFHLIEIISNDSALVSMTYLRCRRNLDKTYTNIPSGVSIQDYKTLISEWSITNAGDAKYVITDVASSNFSERQTVSFKSQLTKASGLLLNWSPVDTNDAGCGIYIGAAFGTGFLTIYEVMNGVINSTTLGSTDISIAVHDYRVVMEKTGSISVYVDGTLSGTVTLTNFFGGYIGFVVYGAVTQKIEYVKIARG